MQTVLQILPL